MNYRIMLIKVAKRVHDAVDVQSILTKYGCCIKTRLGLHEVDEGACSPAGLIILQLGGEACDQEAFLTELNALSNVTAKYLEI